MNGGDWFVAAIIALELGALVFYCWQGMWASGLMWLCLALSNVFWMTGKALGK